MGKYCCVPGCLNSWNQNKNISFHRFPFKRPDILEKWRTATKMKNFEANLFAMVCSDHFTTDCYNESNLHRKLLKKEAIPTIFKFPNEKLEYCNKTDKELQPTSSTIISHSLEENIDLNGIANSINHNEDISPETDEKMHCCESTKTQIKDGWFREFNHMWPEQHLAMKVEKILSCEKSEFQEIMVLQTSQHGRALILDGKIRCTENDEFAYHEMISFLPLCSHPHPERVLILGGGDGGVAREVDKHPLVKEIIQLEIDQKIIDVCKKYLPNMAKGLDSTKLDLKTCDGFEYMRNHQKEFDVIITDSSDPVRPATALFSESYFALLKESLKADGIICSQGGTIWAGLEQIKNTLDYCRKYFKEVRYSTTSVPTFPMGQIGFFMAALNEDADLATPKFKFTEEDLEKYNVKYYNSDIHSASFILPNFAKKVLYS